MGDSVVIHIYIYIFFGLFMADSSYPHHPDLPFHPGCRLKNAMLNLLVVVLGVPDNNHLTMMLLEPTAMLNSFPVGFVYGAMPGPEGYHFDCGCVLDAQGRARPASRNRQPLTNPQLHLLNFCSWTMLALGCWIFPELCNDITQAM